MMLVHLFSVKNTYFSSSFVEIYLPLMQKEHRAELLPVILRLLYGRMRAVKAGGRKKGGKGTVTARRGLILQHLMELSEAELLVFFELVFRDLFTGSQLGEARVAEHILQGPSNN